MTSPVDRIKLLAESFQGVSAFKLSHKCRGGRICVLLDATEEAAGPSGTEEAVVYDRDLGLYRRAEDRPAAVWGAVVDRLVEEFGENLTWEWVNSKLGQVPSFGYRLAWQVRVYLQTGNPVMADRETRVRMGSLADRWRYAQPAHFRVCQARLYAPGQRVLNPKDRTGVYYFVLSYRRTGWRGGRYLCYRETGKGRGQRLVSLNSLRPYSE